MRACIQREVKPRIAALLALTLCSLAWLPSGALAQDTVTDPWRIDGFVSVGGPLRVTRRPELGQTTFAPLFVDATVAVLLPGTGVLRHGPVLGLSTNLTIDGGFFAPVDRLAQWIALVGYMARYALNNDVFALAHAAVPFDLGDSGSVGAELSAGLGYRVLAGVGAFTALSGDVFGGEGGASVIASIEVGMFIDYEVLP